jgi:hypothetical protein
MKSLKSALIVSILIVLFACTLSSAFPEKVFAGDADIVLFPDSNLEQALLDLGADVDGDGALCESELAALTDTLDLSGRNIADIGGLQYATGIVQLNLSGNVISDISLLSALSSLEKLDISDNLLDITDGSPDRVVIDSMSTTCAVTYEPQKSTAVTGVTLPEDFAVCVDDIETLDAIVTPDYSLNTDVSWSTDNELIATVSDGVVTAISTGTVNISVTTEDGEFTDICAITVKPNKLSSAIYMIGDGQITELSKYTTIDQFKANINNNIEDIRVCMPDGTEVTSGYVGTGMTLQMIVRGIPRDSLTVVLRGDVNGDGRISISDYTMARLHILGLKSVEGPYFQAADVNRDGKISISDYTLMRLDILSLKLISGSKPVFPEVSNPRIRTFLNIALAQLGKPYVWGDEGPNTFDCSGFIYYCLNTEGYTVARQTASGYSKRTDWQYVDKNELQPGDLMFYWSDKLPGTIGHVGIYLGNGYHIHASSTYGFIVVWQVEGWYDTSLSHGLRVYQ